MKLKYLLLFIFILLILPLCLAEVSDEPIEIGPYKQNTLINIRLACTYNGGDCATDASCNITVDYPNTTSMIYNENMTKDGTIFNYTLPDSKTVGRYSMIIKCLSSNYNVTKDYYFYITETGEKNSILFIPIIELALKIGIFAFLIILSIWGINRLREANKNNKTPYLMVAMLRVIWGILSYAFLFISPLLALFLFHPNFSMGILQRITFNTYFIIFVLFGIVLIFNVFWFGSNILLNFGGLNPNAERTNKVLNDLSKFGMDLGILRNKTLNRLFKR